MVSTRSVLRLLHTLIKATGAKRFLDIGVFTGCSSLAAALALPDDGRVVGLDVSMEFAKIGMPFWKEAAVDHKIDVRVAPASESLDLMIKNGETFDMIFIDADKEGYLEYFKKSLKVLKKNGIVAVDNVLFHGQVLDLENNGPMPASVRIVNDIIYKDDAVFASMLTVGDGLTLVLKK
ncbi:probable caffeoyl-CoA O-methyltransferase 2 [Ixodes scapularis]|nr:probable caffeoyl-CoA O-methyltransferase 2 [Ixodes scapularis]